MGSQDVQKLSKGIFKRNVKRKIGIFINGTGLDRATRRINKKVDLRKFVSSLSEGLPLEIARYYTLVPHEDDARQLAFLEAVENAGLEVVLKRLPPKGVKRPVSIDVHVATDLTCYAQGNYQHLLTNKNHEWSSKSETKELTYHAVVVCPNKELSYAIYICNQLGVKTTLADFDIYSGSSNWQGIDRWLDLSNSETIWR